MRYQVIVSVVIAVSVLSAGYSRQANESDVTYWVASATDGSPFVLQLDSSGGLYLIPTTGVISKGTWRINGNAIEMELNKRFLRLSGTVEADRMQGIASTKRGAKWKWSATKQPYVVATASPEYPPLARAARVSGSVLLDVEIDAIGGVRSVQFVSGHPLIRKASELAAYKFRFQPDMSSPSRTARLTFIFSLLQIDDDELKRRNRMLSPYQVEVIRGLNIIYNQRSNAASP